MGPGEDVRSDQVAVPALDGCECIDGHGSVPSLGEEASGVPEVDVLKPVDPGSEFVPNETEKAPDPAHRLAGFMNRDVRGKVVTLENSDCVVEMLEAEPLDTRLERLPQPQPNGRLVELPCRRCGHRVELLLVACHRNLTELLLRDGWLVCLETDREVQLGLSALGRPMFPQVDGEVRGRCSGCRRNRRQLPSSRRRVFHAATVPPLDPRAEIPWFGGVWWSVVTRVIGARVASQPAGRFAPAERPTVCPKGYRFQSRWAAASPCVD